MNTLPVLTKGAGVPVRWRELPLQNPSKLVIVPPNERMPTVREIVDSLDLPDVLRNYGEVRINDQLVPREWWSRVRPNYCPEGRVAITISFPLHGGGAGSIIATVATIAVLVLATVVSAGGAGILFGIGAIGPGTWGAAALGAAIGLGGTLAIAALSPPPGVVADPIAPTLAGSATASVVNGAAAIQGNSLAQFAPIPMAIGTHRVSPPFACEPLVELDDGGVDETVEAVFILAGPHQLEDIRSGDTPLDDMEEVEYEVRTGLPGEAELSLVTRQSRTDQLALEMSQFKIDPDIRDKLLNQADPVSNLPIWHTFTSGDSPDEIVIPIRFPEGLFFDLDLGSRVMTFFQIQMRQVGDVDWLVLPELLASNNQSGPFKQTIKLIFDTNAIASDRGDHWVNGIKPPDFEGFIAAYQRHNGQSPAPATPSFVSESWFGSGAGQVYMNRLQYTFGTDTTIKNVTLFKHRADIYLSGSDFPKGKYEIRIKQGYPVYWRDSVGFDFFAFGTYTFQPGTGFATTVYDFFHYWDNAGVFRAPDNQNNRHGRAVIPHVSSIWNEPPWVTNTDLACIAVRARNRQLSIITAEASNIVLDWNGVGWVTQTTSSNPATQFFNVLTGPMGKSPLPASVVDDASIVAWRTQCELRGYQVDAVIGGRKYLEVLRMITSAGFARLRNGNQWGVLIDKDRRGEMPSQIFNARDIRNFSFKRAFTRLPGAIRGTFNDRDDDYERAQEIVLDPVVPGPDVTDVEEINYDGLVTAAQVVQRADFDHKQARFRLTFFSFDTNAQGAIMLERGDLIGLQHQVIKRQAGFARIKSVQIETATNPDTVVGLTLDGSTPIFLLPDVFGNADLFSEPNIFDLGQKTGVTIRLKGGAGFVTREIHASGQVAGHVHVVRFITPFDDPGSAFLNSDCLCSFGPLGEEYRRLIVHGVVPRSADEATVTGVDEAPELWDGPDWVPRLADETSAHTVLQFSMGRYYANGGVIGTLSDIITTLGLTFTRTTAATYLTSTKKVATAASGVIRFGHDSTHGRALGLRLTGARTNLVLRARDGANASWTKTNITAVRNVEGVDGAANTATRITATAGNGTILQGITSASAERITSAWVRRISGSGNLDMTQNNGTLWTTVPVTTAWTRVNIAAATLTNPTVGFRIVTSGDVFAFDFFLHEVGGFIGDDIDTTTATVTQNADSLTDASRTSPTAITKVLEGRTAKGTGTQVLWQIDDNTANNRITVLRNTSSQIRVQVVTGGSTVADLNVATVGHDTEFKIALRAATNNYAASVNGGTVATDTAGTMPSGLTRERWGRDTAGNEWFGDMARSTEFDVVGTNADLIRLSQLS